MKTNTEIFEPIPSLNYLYEISKSGVVRNVKTKNIISPNVPVKVEGKKTSKSISSLLYEVYGIKQNEGKYDHCSINCSCSDGKNAYHFQSLGEMAKFLAPKTHYTIQTLKDYFRDRKNEIGCWKIKYFDEPKVGRIATK